jgi:hypothetical protein
MTETDRANIYRTVVRVAQRALCELPEEPEFARFLEHGRAANDLPDVQLACRQIVSVLGRRLDVGPGPHVLPTPRRLAATSGATEDP